MNLSVYTPPRAEPIHLTEAKLHLRKVWSAADAPGYSNEDSVISAIISACRSVAEAETWRSLVLQTKTLYIDGWPDGSEIILPSPPLREVVHVKYTDSDDTEATFTDYTIDTDSVPGRIVLDYSEVWPSVTLRPRNPIEIRFKCGHVVPFSVNQSTDVITATDHPFSNDDKVRLTVSGGALPAGLSELTDYYVIETSGDTFKLSATSGGSAVDITDAGTGTLFIGDVPPEIVAGMKLIMTDLYEERSDTIVGKTMSALPSKLPRGASILFGLNAVKTF